MCCWVDVGMVVCLCFDVGWRVMWERKSFAIVCGGGSVVSGLCG